MAILRIEMDRRNGLGWELRGEGQIPDDTTIVRIVAEIKAYSIQYAHRAVLNGVVVAEHPGMRRRTRRAA